MAIPEPSLSDSGVFETGDASSIQFYPGLSHVRCSVGEDEYREPWSAAPVLYQLGSVERCPVYRVLRVFSGFPSYSNRPISQKPHNFYSASFFILK